MPTRLMDLMEPEETVGNLWHDLASGFGAAKEHAGAGVTLASVRGSLHMLLHALGGTGAIELAEAPATASRHRLSNLRKLGTPREREYIAGFDGMRLCLPPVMSMFADVELNRIAYFWLTALAAVAEIPEPMDDPRAVDLAQIAANAAAADRAYALCPGLRAGFTRMAQASLARRPTHHLPRAEAEIEAMVRSQLRGEPVRTGQDRPTAHGYMPFAPVPIWLRLDASRSGDTAGTSPEDATAPPPAVATTTRKLGLRRNRDEANRKDSFIIHRFESILSWVESMNLNRSIDDDDDENAQKAAEDQDNITLSKHDRRAATRLRLHLDLSPAEADHEALAGKFTYPEWNHRTRAYMPDHCRILEAEVPPDPESRFIPNQRRMKEVRRQFETLRPRRILRPRQLDGAELDLDALISAQVQLRATGQGSDRVYQSLRQIDRDLSVAFLIDTSRSTEAAVGDTSVIDVARDTLAALAGGIDAAGDRLGIWGFSSLRRDRVFVHRCKAFDSPMSAEVTDRICALRPGHYTRLGAAIRHVSAMLAQETAARRRLLVLTDGKPNDLDHYEGQHGIEDSHMAVREARRLGQTVHGVIIDEDGQDWFARIFGRSQFSLLSNPARLTRALPDIYRSLTQEV
ncbi:nitric oxide reductase activation protein NorD [Pseudorhodobacter sp.]|uniref:nitric oxide reductase activation protein NorD n=1 Tax=Pseudorhodobacter sp. TaxID=1934400 RepID=UPI002648F500|nr:VWA domain-containing protein [Pseudorhodobacter sp.]MDN5788435.1 VWA domain-containing protein [Pseudorhodobacter sp.]